MNADAEEVAEQLIRALGERGVSAKLGNSGRTAAGLYIFGESTDRPLTMVAILLSPKHREYTWGEGYEHALPIDTPVDQVAASITESLDSLPKQQGA